MHEDLTSYDCIIIIFTAILYSPIKVKNYKQLKETCFQLPLILLPSDNNKEHHHLSYHHHHHPLSLQSRARDISSHDCMIIPDRSQLVSRQQGHAGDPALVREGDLELHLRTSEVPHIDVLIEGSR